MSEVELDTLGDFFLTSTFTTGRGGGRGAASEGRQSFYPLREPTA